MNRAIGNTVAIVLVAIAAIIIYRAIPPSRITIETGPKGGSYYEQALRYKAGLKSHGITANLQPNPQSLEIIRKIDSAPGIRIGFVAQKIDPKKFAHVRSLGAIQLQPLFIFCRKNSGNIETLADLRGKRIVMPPEQSATSEAALYLLRQFGVNKQNTTIAFQPIKNAVKALKEGKFTAGFFMLSANNTMITGLAENSKPKLHLLSLRDGLALSRQSKYLRPVVLPRGAFSVQKNIPAHDVDMVAGEVNVIARNDAPAGILYSLLEVMSTVDRNGSLVNSAGKFPELTDISLPPHRIALRYQKSGVPWFYRNLPLWLAELVNSYVVIGIVVVLIAELYRPLEYFSAVGSFILDYIWLWALARIDQRIRSGGGLTTFDLKLIDLAERVRHRPSSRDRIDALVARIRDEVPPSTAPAVE